MGCGVGALVVQRKQQLLGLDLYSVDLDADLDAIAMNKLAAPPCFYNVIDLHCAGLD